MSRVCVCRLFTCCQSESLHREAYNAVFREFAVDYEWSPEYYDELQNKVLLLTCTYQYVVDPNTAAMDSSG